GRRVFLVFGASDGQTSVWPDGQKLGEHQGGYTPFSFELKQARPGESQRLVIRGDDSPHPFKLEGKQGYGKARGMWQTVYLEARGGDPIEAVHFTPDLARSSVSVDVRLAEPAPRDLTLKLAVTNRANTPLVTRRIRRGESSSHFDVALPGARLWSLDDPFLHEVSASVSGDGVATDSLRTYFGMRSISTMDLPGTRYSYVAINGKPVY